MLRAFGATFPGGSRSATPGMQRRYAPVRHAVALVSGGALGRCSGVRGGPGGHLTHRPEREIKGQHSERHKQPGPYGGTLPGGPVGPRMGNRRIG